MLELDVTVRLMVDDLEWLLETLEELVGDVAGDSWINTRFFEARVVRGGGTDLVGWLGLFCSEAWASK